MKLFTQGLLLVAGLIVLVVGAFLPVSAESGTNTISVDEYWDLVGHSRQVVDNVKGLPSDKIREALSGLTGQWGQIHDVRLDDGQLIAVDNSYLLALLGSGTPDLVRIETVLDQLQTAHKTYPSKIFTTADLAALQEILSRPDFQWREESPNPIGEWFQNLWDRFNRWLESIFGGGQGTGQNGGVVIDPLSMLASILLVLILLYVFRTLFVDFVGEAQVNDQNDGSEELLTSGTAFSKAQALSRGGDYRSAVRYLYLSSLLLLDERGLLRFDRSKTNHEYLRSVANSPELAGPLEEVIEVFDDVWYGYHSLDEDSFRHYSDRVEELKEKKG
jgi:hypothetical protein